MTSSAIAFAGHLLNATKHPHDIGICAPWDLDGIKVIRWIEIISGQCVYGTLGAVSWTFGYLSILSWLCAQLPQIITNYQNSSVDGLAPIFLINWFMGDITNLLGCILTQQLPFQTLLACYYVLVDSVLVFQFVFYKILFPPRPQILIPSVGSNFHAQHTHRVITPQATSSAPVAIHRVVLNREFQRSVVSIAILLGFVTFAAATPVDDVPDDYDTTEFVGHVFSWICCLFYLTSRLPQILENYRRKSTQGINIALFTAALCGNLFYTIGILTNPSAHDSNARREFLLNALPYLIGSAGTIVFDITILMQYFRYWGQEPVELDREAIKRYLTTDESWVQHRWAALRRTLQFPFSISIHDGAYRRTDEVIEGIDVDDDQGEEVRLTKKTLRKDGEEASALLGRSASTRSYGTQW